MKRTIALVLAAMMLLSVLLSGCGDNSTSSAVSSGSSVATGDAANADPDNPYANLDLSKRKISSPMWLALSPTPLRK